MRYLFSSFFLALYHLVWKRAILANPELSKKTKKTHDNTCQHYIARIPKDGWSASTRVWKSGSELSGILGVNRHGKYQCFFIPWWCRCWIPGKYKTWKSLDVVKQFHISINFSFRYNRNFWWRFVIIRWWKIWHLWCSFQANLMTSAPAAGDSNKDMEAVSWAGCTEHSADRCSVIQWCGASIPRV